MVGITRRHAAQYALVLSIASWFAATGESLARLPPSIDVRSVRYVDLDGDLDGIPDSGETGRLVVTIENTWTIERRNVILVLSTQDSDVACLTEWSVAVGDLAPGQVLTVGSPAPGTPGFAFRASDGLQTTSPGDPARLDFCIRSLAEGEHEFQTPDCFRIVADLDLPAAPGQAFVAGPDGLPGTADDGTVLETFDTDRDGDLLFSVNDTFRTTDAGTGATTHGFYQRGADASGPAGIAGVVCGGFKTPTAGNPLCVLDPDFPMDWHFHCPPGGPCLNTESGTCFGGCSYSNAVTKALSPPNSLHMGAHFLAAGNSGDTTHLRALQAFVSAPLNLTVNPRPGDLDLSLYQIADLMDETYASGSHSDSQCWDCADVQIQMDQDPDPGVDAWGFWDKLVPYQNVYDHESMAWSAFVVNNYCAFTPGDTGSAPPNPRGTHETMCFAAGAWSRCGDVRGTSVTSTGHCPGPGALDASGTGVWVQTRFDLGAYVGQRIRLRWIGGSWSFDGSADSYYQAGGSWSNLAQDDGWWLDDIRITGVATSQVAPQSDIDPPPASTCPASLCSDQDSDGFGGGAAPPCPAGMPLDCNESNATIHPGAIELNDGLDNQCPGDADYGLVDEVQVLSLLRKSPASHQVCWQDQPGATTYQLVTSPRRDFTGDCTVQTGPVNTLGCMDAPANPPPGGFLYYKIRVIAPLVGSWGKNSAGQEITGICGLP